MIENESPNPADRKTSHTKIDPAARRFDYLQNLLIRDIPLPDQDREILSKARIQSLADWIVQRGTVRITPHAASMMDAQTRLAGLGIPQKLANQLAMAGIDSSLSLASLSDSDRKNLENELRLPSDSLRNYQERAKSMSRQLTMAAASSLLNYAGHIPGWFGLPQPAICGTCAEESSAVGRLAYFRYLVKQTGKTIPELQSELYQNLQVLTPETSIPQINICNEVLTARNPGSLSDQEAAAGRRTLICAYLTLLPGSLAEVASKLISVGELVENQADLITRLRNLIEATAEIVPTTAEMIAFQKLAVNILEGQVRATPEFAGLTNSEINAEAIRRLEELLQPAKRRAAELNRDSLKRRFVPPKSDHQLFRELYIETGLGSCEETTRLNQAISSVQAYLAAKGASPGLAVGGHAYLSYEQWRGDQLGKFYPELRSLLRDDILSGEGSSWDRGSIILDRTSNRAFLQTQLNAVKNAIKKGYLAEDEERKKLVNGTETIDSLGLVKFEDSAYFVRFQEGLDVIDLILEADNKLSQALTAMDNDEPGLAIAHLNDANNALREVGELAFSDGSDLLTTWRCDYRDLAALPSEERRLQLNNAFDTLFSGIKKIYQARAEGEIEVTGLNLSTGLIDNWSRWTTSGVAGKVSLSELAGIQCSHVSTPPDEGEESQAEKINGATLLDSPVGDVQFIVTFQIRSTTNSRAPAVTDHYAPKHYEMIGLAVRRQSSGAQYRIGIETALTESERQRLSSDVTDDDQPPPPPFRWTLAIRKVGGGSDEVLGKLSTSNRLTIVKDSPYVLTVNTVGHEIRAELATPDGLHRSLRVSDSSASALSAGAFGVRATATVNVHFGPIFVESVTRYSVPPFYADRGGSIYYLRSKSIYDQHVDEGKGMATSLIQSASPLVYQARDVAAEQLQIRFDRQPGEIWYLVFESGTQAISLLRLDQCLDRCLALSGYLRYAAIPIRMAQAYAASGDFSQAETLIRIVYDDEAEPGRRSIYPKFSKPPLGIGSTTSVDELIVRLRLGEILIQWAEWLFRQDSDDSRRLAYRLCTRLLALYHDSDFCNCRGGDELQAALQRVSRMTISKGDHGTRSGTLITDILHLWDDLQRLPSKLKTAGELRQLLKNAPPSELERRLYRLRKALKELRASRTDANAAVSEKSSKAPAWADPIKEAEINAIARNQPDFSLTNPYRWLIGERNFDLFTYCIPANPVALEHKRRACLILRHLGECRNVLGYQDDYVPPLRFDALLARARSFADLALSAERDLIAFRDRFEAETFSLLQAQNALEVASATVQLEGMRVSLAESEIIAARLQNEKAQASQAYYDQLVDGGLSDWEQRSLNTTRAAIDWSAAALGLSFVGTAAGSIASIGTGNVAGGVSGMGSALGSVPAGVADQLRQFSQYYGMQANFERREQEWRFQAQMSRFDVLIAQSNVDQAFQRRDIAAQQQLLAELQQAGAADALHFLNNKFLNGAMYLWMMKTVRNQYRTRLNYAISASYMAERALAFELQESVKVIRFDYFDPRRDGLLGATKLETDLATLAEMKLAATKRKLQLSKTISLLQVAPVELDRFKNGSQADDLGRLRFRSLMEWFDRDFPGHYLRLIKAVKVTVVALVPPLEGIHATLSTTGVSKTIISRDGGFKEQTIKRPPESVALSAPFQATGLFVLNYEDELLLPFEGSGVECEWFFEMPKAANRFDYSTIADILITIEYSAFSHDAYRREVIDRLGRSFSATRSFSFRTEFVDQWYDLHNPELIDDAAQQMVVRFETARDDFPPNLDQLGIDHVTLYFAHDDDGGFSPVSVSYLNFEDDGNRDRVDSDVYGMISTRDLDGAARLPASWSAAILGKDPVGTWELSFNFGDEAEDSAIRQRFKQGKIRDILFVISYSGRTAIWA